MNTSIPAHLDREWQRIRQAPRLVEHANGWQVTPPCTDLETVRRATDHRVTDTCLAEHRANQLVRLAAHDDLAARIVLQRILGQLLTIAARRYRHGGNDHTDELIAAAWIAIRQFNPERRPTQVLAAVASDANHLAFRAGRRRVWTEEPTATIAERPERASPSPVVELAALVEHASLDDTDRAVVAALVNAERVPPAESLGVTDRSVRNYRRRVVHRLRLAA